VTRQEALEILSIYRDWRVNEDVPSGYMSNWTKIQTEILDLRRQLVYQATKLLLEPEGGE
jgi:hypothetical protein